MESYVVFLKVHLSSEIVCSFSNFMGKCSKTFHFDDSNGERVDMGEETQSEKRQIKGWKIPQLASLTKKESNVPCNKLKFC